MSRLVLHEVSGILQTIITLHLEQILATGELGEIHLVGTPFTRDAADSLLVDYRPIAGDDGDGGATDLSREDDIEVSLGRDRVYMVDYIVRHCLDAETDIELSTQLINCMYLHRGATLGESLEGDHTIMQLHCDDLIR